MAGVVLANFRHSLLQTNCLWNDIWIVWIQQIRHLGRNFMRCSKYYDWVSSVGNWRRRNGLNDVVFGNVCQFTAVYTTFHHRNNTSEALFQQVLSSHTYDTCPPLSVNIILSNGQNEAETLENHFQRLNIRVVIDK